MRRAIIPKSFKTHSLRVIGWFTWMDLIFTGVFAVIAIIFIFSLSGLLGLVISIILGIVVFSMMMILLIPNAKHKKRNWQLLFQWFIFSGVNKKFTFENKKPERDTKLFCPYKEVKDNYVIAKTMGGKSKLSKTHYLGALEIKGFDLISLTEAEQDIRIQELRDIFKKTECYISLVKLERPFTNINNQKYYARKIEQTQKSKMDANLKEKTINQLKGFLNQYEDGKLSEERIERRIYIQVYGKNLTSLIDELNSLESKFLVAGYGVEILEGWEVVNVIKNIFDPISSDFQKSEVEKYAKDLSPLLSFSNLILGKEYMKIENYFENSKDYKDLYMNFTNLSEYPKYPSRNWLVPLLSFDSNVVINLKHLYKDDFKKTFEKTLLNAKGNLLTTKKRNILKVKEQQYELNLLEDLVDEVANGSEAIKDMNIFFVTHAFTRDELEQKTKFLAKNLDNLNFKLNTLIFKQLEGFSGAMPNKKVGIAETVRTVPSITPAEGFPFLNSSLNDERGLFLGDNTLQSPVIFDSFVIDKKRKNHNGFVLGVPGSGKTTTVKKLLNYFAATGKKVLIIDPEREYSDICEYYGGIRVNASGGDNDLINPLQLLATITDHQTNESIIQSHLQFLEQWFNTLYFNDLKPSDIRYFIRMVGKLYDVPKFKNPKVKLNDLAPTEFPIFDDLIKLIEKQDTKNMIVSEKENHVMVLDVLKSEFSGLGKYSKLYNGHSKIKIAGNKFVVFDILDLMGSGSGNKKVIAAQLYLITAYIQSEINNNFLNSETHDDVVVVIDEAHLLIDENNMIALDFVFQLVKRIRKRRGGIWIISQSPDDFLGDEKIRKKTQAIINNSQYSMIGQLSPKNASDFVKTYRQVGNGISEEEQQYVTRAKKGEFLFFLTPFERFQVQIEITDEERKAFPEFTSVSKD